MSRLLILSGPQTSKQPLDQLLERQSPRRPEPHGLQPAYRDQERLTRSLLATATSRPRQLTSSAELCKARREVIVSNADGGMTATCKPRPSPRRQWLTSFLGSRLRTRAPVCWHNKREQPGRSVPSVLLAGSPPYHAMQIAPRTLTVLCMEQVVSPYKSPANSNAICIFSETDGDARLVRSTYACVALQLRSPAILVQRGSTGDGDNISNVRRADLRKKDIDECQKC